MDRQELDRRKFLQRATAGVAALGSAPIWSWASERKGPPAGAAKGKGWVSIPIREHYGDVEERLQIPPSWELTTYHMAGAEAPVLSPEQIRQRLEAPIGAKRLADLARGKRTAVITFDDLTRPTPTFAVLPQIIAELKLGGIQDDGILFLTSYGAHRPMTQEETERKLGPEYVNQYAWMNHNVFENLTDLGKTSHGNHIKVNRHFMQADLRITVSGVKAHGTAGYGGGPKAILPGVCWMESIYYMHNNIAGPGNKTVGQFKIFKNECRLDMVDAARLARVDFSLQILYNGYRKVIGVFAGDIVEAHHAACRQAIGLLRTECAQNADVVLANAYPKNLQAGEGLSWLRACVREGGTGVLIFQHPQGMETLHYGGERRWAREARAFYQTLHPSDLDVKQAGQLIVYSAYLQKRDAVKFPARTVFTRTWADTVAAIQKAHRSVARVALYPYAGMQHPPGELDG